MRQETGITGFLIGLILVVLLCLDLVLKFLAEKWGIVVWNQGGVWGLWPGPVWVSVTGLILVFLLGIFITHAKQKWQQIGLGLILIGGLGNWLDRLFYGQVRDYIFYPGFNVYGNFADILLAVGIFVLIIFQFRDEHGK